MKGSDDGVSPTMSEKNDEICRLNRYLHPYWPLVLSNVVIPLEKLPSTGVEEYSVLLGEMKEPVGADFIDAKDGLTLIALEEGGNKN